MPIFEMPDGNRYEVNSEEELKELEALFAKKPTEERSALTDMKEGALAGGAAIADLAVLAPKTFAGVIGSAAVAPFVEGGGKEAKEIVYGGLNKLTGPTIGQSYDLTENPAYKAIMYPFEKMGEGFEWFGEKTSPEMQLAAEVGSLFVPLPAGRAIKRGLEKVTPSRDVAVMREELGYGGMSKEELAALRRNETPAAKPAEQPLPPSPRDAEIAVKEQPAMGPVERIMPTEERGLTPARTEDVLAAKARENQSIIDAETGGGMFIRDRQAILDRTQGAPKRAQENAAWQQKIDNLFERPIDPALKRIQEEAAWSDRAGAVPEPAQAGGQRGVKETFSDLLDSIAESSGGKLNFLPGEKFHTSLTNFADALIREGHTTYRRAVEAAKQILKETWKQVAPHFKAAWLYAKNTQPGLSLRIQDKQKYLETTGKKGLKQGGSFTPFSGRARTVKPDLEDFVKRAVDNGFSRDAAIKSYRELYGEPKGTVSKLRTLGDLKKIASAEEALDIASKSADLTKPVDSPLLLNQGRLAAQRTLNKGYTALVEYAETMREQISTKIQRTLTNGKTGFSELYRDMLSKNINDLKEVMTAIKENQFNADFVPNFKSQKQQHLYDAYRKWADTLYEIVNKELVAQGKKPLNKLPNWFPSLWAGDFALPIYAKTEKGQKLVFLVKETSRAKAELARDYLTKELGGEYILGNIEHVPSIHKKKIERSLGLGSAMEDFIKLLGDEDPLTMKAKEAWQSVNDKIAFDTAQYKQRFKYKVGIRGYLGDKPWVSDKQNLQDMFLAIERTSKSAADWVANQEMQAFNRKVQESPIPQNIKNSFENYTDDLLGSYSLHTDGIIDKITDNVINTVSKLPVGRHIGDKTTLKNYLRNFAAWETVRLLGANMRMIVQSEVQPTTVLVPKMVELAGIGGSKDFVSPLIIGHLQGTKMYAATKNKQMMKTLTADEVKMLDYIKQNEVADLLLVERDQFKSKAANDLYKIGSFTLKEIEMHSRFEAFNIMTNYFRHSGYDLDTAMGMADNISRELMGNYAEHVRAGIIKDSGFLGEIAGRLQSFKIFQLSQLAHYINVTKGEKNALPLLSYLSIQSTLGGLIGMIGMDLAETINDMVRSALNEPTMPTIKEHIIKGTNDTLAFGALSTMTDQGLYGAFQFNTVGDLGWKNFLPIVGAQWETIKSLIATGKILKNVPDDELPSSANTYDAAKGILPGAMNKYLENKLLRDEVTGDLYSSKTGKTSYSPEDSRETEPNIIKDTLWNIPSFDRAKEKSLNYMSSKKETDIYQRRQALIDDIIELRFNLDDNPGNEYLTNAYDSKVEEYLDLSGNTGLRELRKEITKAKNARKYGTSLEASQRNKDFSRRERGSEWLDVQER